jgi:hypothetical protein
MMSEVDDVLDRLSRHVNAELRTIKLSPQEKVFIDAAGREMALAVFDYLCKYRSHANLRPFVMAYALAYVIGGSHVWDEGVDRCIL